MSDLLSSLIVDEQTLTRDELARVLGPYVAFSSGGALVIEPAFDRLSAQHRVLCVVLALQALHALGLRKDVAAAPAEIVDLSGMPPGTVRPKLSILLRGRWITRAKDGRYCVPLSSLRRVCRVLSEAFVSTEGSA
jgi:hypothetical protein